MKRTIIRYQVKPDRVAENEELVRAVYARCDVRPVASETTEIGRYNDP